MKLSKTLYLKKLFDIVIITMINVVLIILTNDDNIPFVIFLTILFNSLLLFMYSFSWLPDVWAKETYLTSSFFGFKKNYDYEDIINISEANYGFRLLFKQYTPIQLTFKNKKTLKFTPNKDGLPYLLSIIKERFPQTKIETYIL